MTEKSILGLGSFIIVAPCFSGGSIIYPVRKYEQAEIAAHFTGSNVPSSSYVCCLAATFTQILTVDGYKAR